MLNNQNTKTAWLQLMIKEIKMALVQKTIDGTEYYTDNKKYYTFHQVKLATDTLWEFACLDLGITKKMGFSSREIKAITDLAGIGPRNPTQFLLLQDGAAIPVPYSANGSSRLRPNDIILRSAVDPGIAALVPTVVPSSASTESIADRLTEIAKLHNMKLITDAEYQEKRAKIMAEL